MKTKKFLTVLTIALLVIAMACMIACTPADKGNDGSDKFPSGTPSGTPSGDTDSSSDSAIVNIDINPSLELVVDSENKVVGVRALNDDGATLIYNETGIEGVDIEAAIAKITDLAIELGYLKEGENEVVGTIVNSADSDLAAELTSKINAKITATAENLGLSVSVDAEGAYSLLRKMEEFKAQYPDNNIIQSVSVAKFRLALSASETGEISLEAAIELDDSELIAMIAEADKQIENYATEAFLEKKAQAMAIYDNAVTIQTYSAYTQYYLTNVAKHYTTAYYGPAYQMYASSALGFKTIADAKDMEKSVRNYELDETRVNAILAIFGIEDSSVLKNEDGKITVASVEAYADKVFKNTPASAPLEEKKASLNTALSEAETEIRAELDKLTETYKEEINKALSAAETIYNAAKPGIEGIKAAMKLVSVLPGVSQALEDLDALFSDYEEITAEIKAYIDGDEELTLSALKEISDRYQVKADEYLAKIKADLSEEELAEIDANIAEIIERSSAAKQAFDNAISSAAESVKSKLAEAKEARRNASAQG